MNDLFVGRRVLIKHAEDLHTVADTIVVRYDDKARSIFIEAPSVDTKDRGGYSVYVNFMGDSGLLECKGKMKNIIQRNEIEIALGEFRQINHRATQRHDVSARGWITHICVADRAVELAKPIEFRSINMSSNGVLISAESGTLTIDRKFQGNLEMNDQTLAMLCQVVRIQNASFVREEYGCRILNVWMPAQSETGGAQ